MLHRAIFGSLERFFSIYLEHCGGNFPAWICAAPGHPGHGQRQGRRLRRTASASSSARRGCASTSTTAPTSSARRSATRGSRATRTSRRRPEGGRGRRCRRAVQRTRASSGPCPFEDFTDAPREEGRRPRTSPARRARRPIPPPEAATVSRRVRSHLTPPSPSRMMRRPQQRLRLFHTFPEVRNHNVDGSSAV